MERISFLPPHTMPIDPPSPPPALPPEARLDLLHPQARALLDLMQQKGIPPTHTLSVADARRFYRERRFFTQPDAPALAAVEEIQAEGPAGAIALRLYKPMTAAPAGPLPVLVFFHGGGWVFGDLDTHDTLCRELANGSRCAVMAVDYRLAPEHRFPAAYEDCLAATYWVQANAARLGLDANRIAVGGDSAGGNLAATVSLAARDAGDLRLAFQLLIYPATDQHRTAPSHTSNGEGYLLTRDTIAWFHDHYIQDESSDLDWRASPLLHADLGALPPAFVLVAGYDPLRDEGGQYAQRLSEAGNRCTLVNFERQIHGFITMGRILDEANEAVALCALQLRRALLP
jgi:acetyl esterase